MGSFCQVPVGFLVVNADACWPWILNPQVACSAACSPWAEWTLFNINSTCTRRR